MEIDVQLKKYIMMKIVLNLVQQLVEVERFQHIKKGEYNLHVMFV